MDCTNSTHGPQLLAILAIAVAACTTTEPLPPALTGQYGGRLLGLIAADTAAVFATPCVDAYTGPIRLNATGFATVEGIAVSTSAGFGNPPVTADVRLADPDLLNVTLRIGGGTASSYVLRRNEPPDFSGIGCLD